MTATVTQVRVTLTPSVTQVRVSTGDVFRVGVSAGNIIRVAGTAGVGPQGIQGPPGTPGAGLIYTHTQDSPSTLWTIAHFLNAFLNVTVVDNVGRQVEADVVYVNSNVVTIEFARTATGIAYLS